MHDTAQVTLRDYYILVPEAVKALEEREEALAHMHALEDELARTQHQLEAASSKVGRGHV
jgi:hypothetical protein